MEPASETIAPGAWRLLSSMTGTGWIWILGAIVVATLAYEGFVAYRAVCRWFEDHVSRKAERAEAALLAAALRKRHEPLIIRSRPSAR